MPDNYELIDIENKFIAYFYFSNKSNLCCSYYFQIVHKSWFKCSKIPKKHEHVKSRVFLEKSRRAGPLFSKIYPHVLCEFVPFIIIFYS